MWKYLLRIEQPIRTTDSMYILRTVNTQREWNGHWRLRELNRPQDDGQPSKFDSS